MEQSPVQVVFFDIGDTLIDANRRWIVGAKELLRTLRTESLRLGIISNTGNLTRVQLAELLPDDFDWDVFEPALVLLSAEVGVAKPSPAIFEQAVGRAGLPAVNCLFCTEDLLDTLVAQKVGMRAARLEKPPRSDLTDLAPALLRSCLIRGTHASPRIDSIVASLSAPFSFSEEELMAKKQTHTGEPADGSDDVSATVQALTQVAQSLTQSATQMMQTMQAMQLLLQDRAPSGPGPAAAGPTTQINTWGDDPYSEDTPTDDPPLATPIKVPVPVNRFPLLQIQIVDRGPPAGLYDPGSADFRYWVAFEALTRGINFWGERLPAGTRWTTMNAPMQVSLVAGEDLNANYSRQFGLRFYQDTVQGVQVFSGESPDVSCHELGHAILDAVRPELFDAASIEVASFHESFGDMSAILSALQLDPERALVFEETEGHLNVNSRLSRLAEQLGWAIRQLSPTAVDPDCLRNAANRLFYRDPDDLPPSAPSSQLASEPHSFSRVFTGAFLDALARMLTTAGPPSADGLKSVSRDLGQLLIDGVRLAPVTSGYYSQVAAAMIQSDQARFSGRYRTALSSAFIQHGILAPSAAASLTRAPTPQMVASAAPTAGFEGLFGAAPMLPSFGQESEGYRSSGHDAPQLPMRTVATRFGMDIDAHVPAEALRFNVAPAAQGAAVAPTRAPEEDARSFVEDLIQLGRVDFASVHNAAAAELVASGERSRSKKTHTLVANGEGKMVLKRLHFNCGCHGCR